MMRRWGVKCEITDETKRKEKKIQSNTKGHGNKKDDVFNFITVRLFTYKNNFVS